MSKEANKKWMLSEKGIYEDLLSHIEHHDIRGWLALGARGEDANTIWSAVDQMTDAQLQRGLARMLSRHYDPKQHRHIPAKG
jgi:hypothetical protein